MLKPSLAVVLVVLVVSYLVFGLATLTLFPLVWEDEPWYTQSAWSFAQNGTFALPMFADLGGFERENVVYGRLYLAAVGLVYDIAGVSPFTARVVSFVSGLVAVAAVFGIGRELWNERAGLAAAILLGVAPNFVVQSHDARPELMLVAAWTTALYLVLSGARLESLPRMVLGGLLASLAGDVHFNGLIVPIAIGAGLFVRRTGRRSLLAFGVGVAAGGAWWLWVHVLQDPDLFRQQLTLYSRGLPLLDVLTAPAVLVGVEVARYLLVEPRVGVLLTIAGVVAGAYLLRTRRDAAVLSLLAFTLFVAMFLLLAVGPKTPLYAVLLAPVAALLVGRFVDVRPGVGRPVAAGVATVSLVSIALLAGQLGGADYGAYIAKLREHVPTGSRMAAHPTVWFGFMDQPFIATHYFLWAGPYEDELRRLGIEHVIADEFASLPGCAACRETMGQEARSFLAAHGELVAEVEDPFYGRVPDPDGSGFVSRIYRVADQDE